MDTPRLSLHVAPRLTFSPWQLLRSLTGYPRWALFFPDGLTLLGWGIRREALGQGARRFTQLRQAWLAWKQEAEPLREFPLFLVGAFLPAGAWSPRFPETLLVMPQGVVVIPPQGEPLWMGELPLGLPEDLEEHAMAPLPPLEAQQEGLSPQVWQVLVEQALAEIEQGNLAKVVLARYRHLKFADVIDPVTVLARLHARYPRTIRFLFEPVRGHAWVGATPEMLIAKQGRRISTVALAGSIPRGATPEADALQKARLLHSEKNLREHRWVVQAILQGLLPWVGDVDMPDGPRLRTLPNIHHLETPIRGRQRRGDIFDLVQSLHPTPAVGGWPRGPALTFLRQHEPFTRGWYTGPIGYVTLQGDGRVAVGLRAARIVGREVWLYAGAGIVAGSQPAQEWEEIDLKFLPLMEALGA